MNDTSAAISTPLGEGAIAVLRMSGPRAVEIAGRVFRGKVRAEDAAVRMQYFGAIGDGGHKLDDVLLTVFRAPHSYTGEDVVEIAGHGGVLVVRRILDLLLKNGARSAEPGEFTQRAYLNGKLDLTQAEAVMDLISAQTDLSLRAATEQLSGKLGERVRALRAQVLATLAHVADGVGDAVGVDSASSDGAAESRRGGGLVGHHHIAREHGTRTVGGAGASSLTATTCTRSGMGRVSPRNSRCCARACAGVAGRWRRWCRRRGGGRARPPPRTDSCYWLAGPAARGAAQWTPAAESVYSFPRVLLQRGGRPMSGSFALVTV